MCTSLIRREAASGVGVYERREINIAVRNNFGGLLAKILASQPAVTVSFRFFSDHNVLLEKKPKLSSLSTTIP